MKIRWGLIAATAVLFAAAPRVVRGEDVGPRGEAGARGAPDLERGDVVAGAALGSSDAKGTSARMNVDALYWALPALGIGVHASVGSDPMSSSRARGAVLAEPTLAGRVRVAGRVFAFVSGGLGVAYVTRPTGGGSCGLGDTSGCAGSSANVEGSASIAGGLLIHYRDLSVLPLVRFETLAFKTDAVVGSLGFGGHF